jgi:tRNA-binding EMAP/Myf-like protein
MGEESQGMMLAASHDGKLCFVTPEKVNGIRGGSEVVDFKIEKNPSLHNRTK